MFGDLSQQTFDLLSKINLDLGKTSITQGSNLNAFDLRGPALNLYPVITPLRNSLSRDLSDRGDLATRWKAITGVNTTNLDLGVAPGRRGAEMQITEQDYVASYAGIGMEASIDWEAVWSGGKEFDNKATLTQALLRSVMIGEEAIILNGNASLALGTPAQPTITAGAANSGTVPNTANTVCFVVALTARGLLNSTIAGGVPTVVTRVNIDGKTDTYGGGSSNLSPASGTITPSGTTSVILKVAAVKGAVGYAWYLGTNAANALLAAVTTVNTATITAAPTGTQTASQITADNSVNSTIFDGYFTQTMKANPGTLATSGSYWKSLDGGTLTSDTVNGIVEIDAALQWFWDNKRLSPTDIWINSQEARNINKKVVSAGGVPLFRFTMPSGQNGPEPVLLGGTSVAKYWNKFTQQFLDIRIHPNQIPGTIQFTTSEIPYPLSGVDKVNFIRCRKDYYQIEWPLVSRQYVYGVYADEVLVCRAPFSLGIINNIIDG